MEKGVVSYVLWWPRAGEVEMGCLLGCLQLKMQAKPSFASR